MKRTKPQVVGPSFLEFHEFSHYINDIDAVGDLLYGVGGDHERFGVWGL
jgi:hypothetical protein